MPQIVDHVVVVNQSIVLILSRILFFANMITLHKWLYTLNFFFVHQVHIIIATFVCINANEESPEQVTCQQDNI